MTLIKDNIQLRRLDETDVIDNFDCGDEDLNDFIASDACLYYKVRIATSYVVEDVESYDVIGYFSLAHDRISLTDFLSNSAYNRFRKFSVLFCMIIVQKLHSFSTFSLETFGCFGGFF